jgi:hypothetical protein
VQKEHLGLEYFSLTVFHSLCYTVPAVTFNGRISVGRGLGSWIENANQTAICSLLKVSRDEVSAQAWNGHTESICFTLYKNALCERSTRR